MIKTKKSLGQHFLKSKDIISAIAGAGYIRASDIVLEIGPGEGTLTKTLLKLAGRVIAVEKDRRLIPVLKEKFSNEIKSGNLELIEKDILELDMSKGIFDSKRYKLIANIPYYITGQIIRKFLETENQPELMVLLVQKEVAERIMARGGKESLLSLSVKAFGDPKIVRTVKRGSFAPAPKVDSAVLSIENISKKRLGGISEKLFFEVLHAGFAHKRKQLLPNLSVLFPKEILIKAFKNVNIELKARAEDISLPKWLKLCKTLHSGIE